MGYNNWVKEMTYKDLCAIQKLRYEQKCFELVCEVKEKSEDQILKEKYFDHQIFMGAGSPDENPPRDHTSQDISVLKKKINKAIEIIGGMQQNGGMGYEFDKKSDKIDKKDLKNITEDIVMALTGKRIKITL